MSVMRCTVTELKSGRMCAESPYTHFPGESIAWYTYELPGASSWGGEKAQSRSPPTDFRLECFLPNFSVVGNRIAGKSRCQGLRSNRQGRRDRRERP